MSRILRTTRNSVISCVDTFCGDDLKVFVLVAILLNSIDFGFTIQCYKCAVAEEKIFVSNNTLVTPICSKFDESDEYITNCPFSTMCLKTISTLHLQNGQKLETVTRGCAQQKDTTQVFRNRQWQHEHSVQEVYEEGCEEFREDQFAASIKTHCYCRGDLCNSAKRVHPFNTLATEAVAVIIAFTTRHLLI